MGLFGKQRTGTFVAADRSGCRFTWTIPRFFSYPRDTTLDSDNMASSAKVKFHLHMTISGSGDIGLYIHYKKPPIPKYSYHFENTQGKVMRQHTAHTIPADTERCGHWNVSSHEDMKAFLGDTDTLLVRLVFDDDTITVRTIDDENRTSVRWTIPNVAAQNLYPFSSNGFLIGRSLLTARVDVKREQVDAMASYNDKEVLFYIVFLFCRQGQIPPHSIDLLDTAGHSYAREEAKEEGTALTMMVSRHTLKEHIGDDGDLIMRIDFLTGGNPLEALNALSGGNATDATADRKTDLGNKAMYNLMED